MSLFHKAERICPNCGMSVPEGNLFCEACGTRYEAPQSKPSPVSGMRCPNGHPVENGEYAFCVVCGAKLVEAAGEETAPEQASGWRCEKCGSSNEEGNLFCVNCGTARGAEPAPENARTVALWRCGKCGSENSDEDGFCVNCGTARGAEAAPEAVPAVEATDSGLEKTIITKPEDVVIPERKPSAPLPEIPDIMKPLTNSDMRREETSGD